MKGFYYILSKSEKKYRIVLSIKKVRIVFQTEKKYIRDENMYIFYSKNFCISEMK